jgi:hypothetical protein
MKNIFYAKGLIQNSHAAEMQCFIYIIGFLYQGR